MSINKCISGCTYVFQCDKKDMREHYMKTERFKVSTRVTALKGTFCQKRKKYIYKMNSYPNCSGLTKTCVVSPVSFFNLHWSYKVNVMNKYWKSVSPKINNLNT